MRPNHTTLPFLFSLLAFVLASLLGAAAAFAQTNPFGGGDGTEGNPYQISTLDHLHAIKNNSGSSGENYLAAGLYFTLMNDLDFAGSIWGGDDTVSGYVATGWPGVGTASDFFEGIFEGNGNNIHNLYINGANFLGFIIGISATGEVRNLGLTDVVVRGASNVGALTAF